MRHSLANDQVVFRYDPNLPPALTVADGDVVDVETRDCFNNQIHSESDVIASDIDVNSANPVTGPIYVAGLEVGDGLALDILDIRLIPQVISGLMPGIGVLSKQYSGRRTVVGVFDGQTVKVNNLSLPARLMIGTIGTAPAAGSVPSLLMGDHGGNMDHPVATLRSTIYLPVQTRGGLFALGDLHAAMGDGEITALSAEGSGWVTLKVQILKGQPVKRPYFRTPAGWVMTGQGPGISAAIAQACAAMAELLAAEYGLSADDAAIVIGLSGDVRVSQCAGVPGMDSTARCYVPFLTTSQDAK
jgi:amidase